jgi:hypothetical protein
VKRAKETSLEQRPELVDGEAGLLAAGDSIDDLLAEFPDLEREDFLACLEFAARTRPGRSVAEPTVSAPG